MATQFNIAEFIDEFKERSGFGVTGDALDDITKYLNERIPDGMVRINVPYHGFNVRGRVAKVHRDVYGLMPSTYFSGDHAKCLEIEDTDTLYYGDTRVTRRGTFIPFLSDCDVYFVEGCSYSDDGTLVVDLKKGPNWRMYL